VRVLAAGVPFTDLLMREAFIPKRRRCRLRPGRDLIGVVDRTGDRISGIELDQVVAALTVTGGYAGSSACPRFNSFECRPDWIAPKRSAW
jgi:NADPH:quinone reductase-like Zn-dependent oxidoreductase